MNVRAIDKAARKDRKRNKSRRWSVKRLRCWWRGHAFRLEYLYTDEDGANWYRCPFCSKTMSTRGIL